MVTIVEVGAHTGVETANFLMDSEARVFSFEPEQFLFKELVVKFEGYSRLTVLPFAVDIGDNQEPLFHYIDGKSTLDPPMLGSLRAQFTMTWTIRLDTFMRLYSLSHIDYLRIDAPWREEMCLESLDVRIDDVKRGRIRLYGANSIIPGWLIDHGFYCDLNSKSDNVTEQEVRFWRP